MKDNKLQHDEEVKKAVYLKFTSDSCPSISLNNYIRRLKKYITNDKDIWSTSWYATDLFLNNLRLEFSILNSYRILLTALVLSYKFHDDTILHFHELAAIGGVTPDHLFELELLFLKVIDWRIYKCSQFFKHDNKYDEFCIAKKLCSSLKKKNPLLELSAILI